MNQPGAGGRPERGANPSGDARAPVPELDRNTRLAAERNLLAEERTLMAWLRTSLSMIGFGMTYVKFVEWTRFYSAEKGLADPPLQWSTGSIWVGLLMVGLGSLSLGLAVVQHRSRIRELGRLGISIGWDLVAWVAIAIALLGAFGLVILLFGS
ncbi:MAG: YidH family protein [Alphaproteobacteria bacterium]